MPLVNISGQDHHDALACLDVAKMHNNDHDLPVVDTSAAPPAVVVGGSEEDAVKSVDHNDEAARDVQTSRAIHELRENQTNALHPSPPLSSLHHAHNGTSARRRPSWSINAYNDGSSTATMNTTTATNTAVAASCRREDNEEVLSRSSSLTSQTSASTFSVCADHIQQEVIDETAELDVSGWSNPHHRRLRCNTSKKRRSRRDSLGMNVSFLPKNESKSDLRYITSATEEETEHDTDEDYEDTYDKEEEQQQEDDKESLHHEAPTENNNRRRFSLFFPFASPPSAAGPEKNAVNMTQDEADPVTKNGTSTINDEVIRTAAKLEQAQPPSKNNEAPQVYIPPPEIEKLELRIGQLSLDLARASSQNDTYQLEQNRLNETKSKLQQENETLKMRLEALAEENALLKRERREQRRIRKQERKIEKEKSVRMGKGTKKDRSKKSSKSSEQSKGIHLSFARMNFGHDASENRSLGLDLLANERDEVVW